MRNPLRHATAGADGIQTCDLLVVGGGVNGTGIARDAAGRGMTVVLCEQHDLSAHTSSSSTKLIHGGLRYLEHFEFRLVRKALQEREVLLRSAPHIVRPLRFVMPHDAHLRPAWMIRAGLFLYDHLGRRELLPGSAFIDLEASDLGRGLQPRLRKGFLYSDAWVDDARLVTLTALDAAERGATILPRTRVVSATRGRDGWDAELACEDDGEPIRIRARALVNATGPWAESFERGNLTAKPAHTLTMVKGSHIVVPKLFAHDHAYILQNHDRRIIFAIPYEDDFTLIGTTEVPFAGDPAAPAITTEETRYLCDAVNGYFARPVTPDQVVWSYSGVRPLLQDEAGNISEATRDYLLNCDAPPDRAPLLSVFGGKLTTFRRLAEEGVNLLAPALGNRGSAWTATAPLPGGDIAGADFGAFLSEFRRQHAWLPDALSYRYARAYGTRVHRLLGDAHTLADLGKDLGHGLFEAEVDYLVNHEWARTPEDILWRRSKLGLRGGAEMSAALETVLPSILSGLRTHEGLHAAGT